MLPKQTCHSVERSERQGTSPAVWVLDLGCPPKTLAGIVDVVQRLQNDLYIHMGLISEITKELILLSA